MVVINEIYETADGEFVFFGSKNTSVEKFDTIPESTLDDVLDRYLFKLNEQIEFIQKVRQKRIAK
jgi:hypothetical protein